MTGAGLLLAALGGATGSVARVLLGHWVNAGAAPPAFPRGTFVVNLAGCLAVGLLAGLAERDPGWLTPDLRMALFAGLLGGFTTFSAFGLETVQLLRRGEWLLAAGYAGGSVLLGLVAVWLGLRLTGPA